MARITRDSEKKRDVARGRRQCSQVSIKRETDDDER